MTVQDDGVSERASPMLQTNSLEVPWLADRSLSRKQLERKTFFVHFFFNTELLWLQVCELCPLRSVLEVLKDVKLRLEFPLPRLCDFAVQVVEAMAYLEGKQLTHRTLAARNVLLASKTKVCTVPSPPISGFFFFLFFF